MDTLGTINSFLDTSLGDKITVPELENNTIYILKPNTDKKHYEAYKNYFTILKFNVLDTIWRETQANPLRYKKLLEAALAGDRLQFLSIAKEMDTIKK
ncbi:MAG: hypothetical protein PHD83_04595 [Caldisericia bacterium]|nr:hypothetical protein [Caldisericia bacterium]